MIGKELLTDVYPIKPLGEVVTFLDHLRKPVTASDRTEGAFPYYGANGLQGTIDSYIFDEPLILLAEDGGHFGDFTRSIAYKVEGKCWVNNHAHVLRPNPNVDIDYLTFLLAQYDVRPFINGATRAKLNKGEAEKIPVPLPPLPIQKKIAAVLEKADELRRKREEQIKRLDDLLQATFLDMFGDPVTNPKGWDQTILSRYAAFENGDRSSNYPNEKDIADSGVLFLSTANIKGQVLDLRDRRYISEEKFRSLRKGHAKKNDLIITLRGSIGQCCIFNCKDDNAFINAQMMIVRPTEMDPIFLHAFLTTNTTQKKLLLIGSGSAQPQLTANQLKDFEIFVPPLNLQNRFSELVVSIRRKKDHLTRIKEAQEQLFNSLMQQAFKGELELK